MITNDQQFEMALNEAMGLLDTCPVAGGADERRLLALIDQIRTYRPELAASEKQTAMNAADSLLARAVQLKHRVEEDEGRAWYKGFSNAFHGIGNSVTGGR